MFRFIDLFAGIGGFRVALESVGGVCVASAEINAQAIEVYRANWFEDDSSHNLGDISKLSLLPEHDLMVGGVPCQPWSIAGQNKGFDDPRGQLWGDVIRLVELNRPKGFIFENVKGMVDPRHTDCLEAILSSLRQLGYNVQAKLLNAFDYGVPQNRDRVFVVGTRADCTKSAFVFPQYQENKLRLFDIFDIEAPKELIADIELERDLFGKRIGTGFNKLTPKDHHNEFFILNDLRHGPTSIHSWEIYDTTNREKMICLTQLRNRRNKKFGDLDGSPLSYTQLQELIPDLQEIELEKLIEKKILIKTESGSFEFLNRRMSSGINGTYRIFLPTARFFGTLTARGMNDEIAEIAVTGNSAAEYKQNFIEQILRPKLHRPITVREAARLQAFPEYFLFHKSDTVSMRLLGNSVAIKVVQAVATSLIATGVFSRVNTSLKELVLA
jgi:DNA (cytosine-5)-methyltransferase 1